MTLILAIDPGSSRSAWVLLDGGRLEDFGIGDDPAVLEMCRTGVDEDSLTVVIEDIEPRQQPLGREVADTLRWIGRFAEAAQRHAETHLITRRAVTTHLVDGGTKDADKRIRAALIDRFGGQDAIRKGGPLYGVGRDVWSALAVGVAWSDGAR